MVLAVCVRREILYIKSIRTSKPTFFVRSKIVKMSGDYLILK